MPLCLIRDAPFGAEPSSDIFHGQSTHPQCPPLRIAMIHSHARSGDKTSRPIGPAEGDAPCTRRRGHLTRWWARPLGGSTQLTGPLELGSAPAFNVRMEAVIVVIGRAVAAVAVAAVIALAAADAAALVLVVATLLPVLHAIKGTAKLGARAILGTGDDTCRRQGTGRDGLRDRMGMGMVEGGRVW